MRNIKLGKKLGLAFGLVLLLTACSGIFSIWETNVVSESFDFVTDDLLAALFDGAETLGEGNDVVYAITRYRFTETPEMLKQAQDSLNNLRAALKTTEDLMVKYPRLQLVRKYLPQITANINGLISETEGAFRLAEQKETARLKLVASVEPVYNSIRPFFSNRVNASLEAIDSGDFEAAKRRIGQQVVLIEELINNIMALRVIVNRSMNDQFSTITMEDLKKETDDIRLVFEKLKEVSLMPATRDAVLSIENSLNEWLKASNEYINLRHNLMAIFERVEKAQDALKVTLAEYNSELSERAQEIGDSAMSDLVTMRNVIIFGMVFSILLGIIISFFTARAISRPIGRVVGIAKRIGQGDYTVKREEFGYEGKDEIASLVDAFDEMLKEQLTVINRILDIAKAIANESLNLAALSEETSASMEEIRASVDQITSLSSNNSSALEQSNAGVEEMSAGAATVAQSSTNGAQNASTTSEVTENAVHVVEDVISQINKVGDTSDENEREIRELVSSVEQITGFVSVITSIADQTNLLALNAAIEAARAGEAGRGFAVVADEVRKLAEESGHAAKSIREQISGLQSSAHKAIEGTVKSTEIVREVLVMAGKAQAALNDGLSRMRVINDEIQNIAAIAQEQAASSKEMSTAIDVVTQGTVEVGKRIEGVQNASTEASEASEGVAMAAQTLSNHAENLTETLSHFKIEEDSGKSKLAVRAK